MIKILVYEQMPKSAVSFYRSVGVFSYLFRITNEVIVEVPKHIAWDTIAGADIIYVERPSGPEDLKAIKLAKMFGIKVWVDIDDLLHEIPEYNPAYIAYNNGQRLATFEECLKLADVVTVSTQKLLEYYIKFNPKIYILENAFNDYAFPLNFHEGAGKKIVNWRGSITHRHDLMSVAKLLHSASITHPEWKFSFVGNEHWYASEQIKNRLCIPEQGVLEYFKVIYELSPDIQICPLVFNNFNISKSNISYIEGTYSGAVTIAPDMPEFNRPGCLCYKDMDQFGYYLDKAIKSNTFREENYKLAYDYVKENLVLSKVNQKRLDIAKEVAGR